MDKGIYCLVFFTRGSTVRIGALGNISFVPGWYVYVGSALGSGGLARVRRHIALSTSRDRQPKWHVDNLLVSPHFTLSYTVTATTEEPLECGLARLLGGPGISGFGCSDCTCGTHLFFRHRDPRRELVRTFRNLFLTPSTTSIIGQEGKG